MCGIAGFIGSDPRLTEACLLQMQSALHHRGPDDAGHVIEPTGGVKAGVVGLAHTRLSIQDLSAAGHQPMQDPDQTRWMAYNGEVYNAPEERKRLEADGEAFVSSSDTEVILRMFSRDGVVSSLPRLNGMFALALYESSNATCTLVRDRAGQKPLYYMHLADGSLVFASEIPALLASGLVDKGRIDLQGFDQFWTIGYTAGERTFYQDIHRLPPGHSLHWEQGAIDVQAYWSLDFCPDEEDARTLDDCADELEELLRDAMRLRFLSDVPLGLCLSGGIDSALMALMVSQIDPTIPAYTISFSGTGYDESAAAAAVADHLGLPHHILEVSAEQQQDFQRIAEHMGEPFGDVSVIPTYYLSEMIRKHATVALTGDAGDELFGGYSHYFEGLRIWGRGEVPPRESLGVRERILRMLGLKLGYNLMQRHLNQRTKRHVYTPDARKGIQPGETFKLRRRWMDVARRGNVLEAMQNADFHVYLTDDVLAKADRMSMAHGLELRSPFLDHRIMEWAARLPTRYKIGPDGRGKYILRHILSRHLPSELYERPKQGFTPPWEEWCRGGLRNEIRTDWKDHRFPLVSDEAVEYLVPPAGEVSSILSWMAFTYAKTCRRWLDDN